MSYATSSLSHVSEETMELCHSNLSTVPNVHACICLKSECAQVAGKVSASSPRKNDYPTRQQRTKMIGKNATDQVAQGHLIQKPFVLLLGRFLNHTRCPQACHNWCLSSSNTRRDTGSGKKNPKSKRSQTDALTLRRRPCSMRACALDRVCTTKIWIWVVKAPEIVCSSHASKFHVSSARGADKLSSPHAQQGRPCSTRAAQILSTEKQRRFFCDIVQCVKHFSNNW